MSQLAEQKNLLIPYVVKATSKAMSNVVKMYITIQSKCTKEKVLNKQSQKQQSVFC